MNSLPKTVTRQRRGCNLNPGPTAPESSTLTTRLPSHPEWCGMAGIRVGSGRRRTLRDDDLPSMKRCSSSTKRWNVSRRAGSNSYLTTYSDRSPAGTCDIPTHRQPTNHNPACTQPPIPAGAPAPPPKKNRVASTVGAENHRYGTIDAPVMLEATASDHLVRSLQAAMTAGKCHVAVDHPRCRTTCTSPRVIG